MKNKILSCLLSLVSFLVGFQALAADNITSLGQISAVYQAQGDMMTLNSGALPLRIAIGTTGQVLTVSGGIPVWASAFAGPTVSGNLTFSDAAASIIGGATSLTVTSGGSVILKAANDAQRLLTYAGSSDTVMTLAFGDGGVTAAQTFTVSSSTLDADDDSVMKLSGGGGTAVDGTRGGSLVLYGNEAAGVPGNADIILGGAAANFRVIGASGGLALIDLEDNGDVMTVAAEVALSVSGKTLAIQEATAGSACSGTLTANGATPVVTSTTCATTGSRIFTQRTSAETGAVNVWISAISTGVSFSVTGEAADTGTYNWFIIHEAA
jgi:hypothetical protein